MLRSLRGRRGPGRKGVPHEVHTASPSVREQSNRSWTASARISQISHCMLFAKLAPLPVLPVLAKDAQELIAKSHQLTVSILPMKAIEDDDPWCLVARRVRRNLEGPLLLASEGVDHQVS